MHRSDRGARLSWSGVFAWFLLGFTLGAAIVSVAWLFETT